MVPRERYAITFLKFFFYVLFANNMKQKMAGTGVEGHKRTVCDFILELYTDSCPVSVLANCAILHYLYVLLQKNDKVSVSIYCGCHPNLVGVP